MVASGKTHDKYSTNSAKKPLIFLYCFEDYGPAEAGFLVHLTMIGIRAVSSSGRAHRLQR